MIKKVVCVGAVAMASTVFGFSCQEFKNPPKECYPETWFHLIGGNVSTNGLIADLDAISEAGISGIHLFHGAGGKWPGVDNQIQCLSQNWDELIKFVADGCEKRGLSFKMQNCPGWSMSGGPWISHDKAMRNLTYSRKDVVGGEMVGELPQPEWKVENHRSIKDLDYKDLFVLAFPTPKNDDGKVYELKPTEQSTENNVMRQLYEFDEPTLVQSIELPSPGEMNFSFCYTPDARVKLLAFEEKKETVVLDEEIPDGVWQDNVPLTFACSAIKAKKFMLEVKFKHEMNIKKIKFHSAARMNNWEGLAGWVLRGIVRPSTLVQDSASYIDENEIIDITDKYKDGRLNWMPPKDRDWTILRIGHINNGRQNAPAPREATGWECNKMDRDAIDLHFDSYIGRLAKGSLAGGKLKGFVVDSWECCRQTWTQSLEEDFRKANNYDFRKKLPAVFGWVISSPKETEAFLLDWRRTLGDLITTNYYARMSERAKELGMSVQYETAFGDVLPGDIMKFWKYCDVPMCEFWHPRGAGNVGQDEFKDVAPCVSATHIYGKKRCDAESFTNMSLAWDEELRELKRTANHALARGVTHLVFHTYTHNPRTDFLPPGTSFGGGIGAPFLRSQTWWHAMKDFTDYFARCSLVLESGKPCSDILWFLGDEVGHKPRAKCAELEGFARDYCNPDVLLTRVTTKDGKIRLPDGVEYKVLYIPEGTYLAPKTKEKLAELEEGGARVVIGTAKEAIANLEKDVIIGENERKCEGEIVEEPLEWIHRKLEDRDIYFVCANGPNGYKGKVSFRANGAIFLSDPVTGNRIEIGNQSEKPRTELSLDLACGESMFIEISKFSDVTLKWHTEKKWKDVARLNNWEVSFPSGWGAIERLKLEELKSWTDLPIGVEGQHFSGTATYKTKFIGKAGTAQIDLGKVDSLAVLYVNGKKIRTLWAPPYRCEIELKEGENEIRVDVSNTWFNRLKYDASLPEKERKTWTICGPKKDAPSKSSGLLGPVVIRR